MADGTQYSLTDDEIRSASDALKAQEQERRAYRQQSWDMTQPAPEQAAEAMKLGGKFGVPRQAVEADPDYWRQRDADAQRRLMESASPKTMAWLDDEENYSVGKDDIDIWGSIEGYFGDLARDPITTGAKTGSAIGGAAKAGWLSFQSTGADADREQLEKADRYYDELDAWQAREAERKAAGKGGLMGRLGFNTVDVGSVRLQLPGDTDPMPQPTTRLIDEAFKQDREWWQTALGLPGKGYRDNPREVVTAIKPLIQDKMDEAVRVSMAKNKAVEEAMPQTGDFLADSLLGGVRAITEMVPLMVSAIATRGKSIPTAVMGAQVYYNEYATGRERELGIDKATERAVLQAGVEAVSERISLGIIDNMLKDNGSLALRFGKGMILEQGQEQIATMGGRLVDWAYLEQGKTLDQFIAETPRSMLQTSITTLVASSGMQTTFLVADYATKALINDSLMMQPSKADKKIDDLLNAVSKSRLRARSPEKAAALATQLAEGTGAETVVIDLDGLAQSLEAAGLNIMDAMTEMGIPADAINETAIVMGQVEVPTARLMVSEGIQTHRDKVQPHLRLKGEDLTPAQKEAIGAEAANQAAKFSEAIREDVARDADFAGQIAEVEDQVTEQLRTAGFSGQTSVLRANAVLASRMAGYIAKRSGKDVRSVWAEMGPKIVGSFGEAGTTDVLRSDADSVNTNSIVARGEYSRGLGAFSVEIVPEQRADGSYVLTRKITDEDGEKQEFFNKDGSWQGGRPSTVILDSGIGGVTQGPEVFPDIASALQMGRQTGLPEGAEIVSGDQSASADLLAQSIRQAARMDMTEVKQWVIDNVTATESDFPNGDVLTVIKFPLTEDAGAPEVMLSIRLKADGQNQSGRADVNLFLDNQMADALDSVEDPAERGTLAKIMFAKTVMVMRQYAAEYDVKAFNFIAAESQAEGTNAKSREDLYRFMLSSLPLSGYTAYELDNQMSVVREQDGAKSADPLFPSKGFVLVRDGVNVEEFARNEIIRGSQRGGDAGEVVTALTATRLGRKDSGDRGGRGRGGVGAAGAGGVQQADDTLAQTILADPEVQEAMADPETDVLPLTDDMQVTELDEFLAFHGTLAKFDKFEMDKMGSGEGAQAFGPGHYFTQSRGVAEWYRKRMKQLAPGLRMGKEAFNKSNPAHFAMAQYWQFRNKNLYHELFGGYKSTVSDSTHSRAIERAIGWIQYEINAMQDSYIRREPPDYASPERPVIKDRQELIRFLEAGIAHLKTLDPNSTRGIPRPSRKALRGGGNIYTVAVKLPSEFTIQLDLPFGEQPAKVQAAFRAAAEQGTLDDVAKAALEKYGDATRMTVLVAALKAKDSPAMAVMRANGIRGVRYLDGLSRGKKNKAGQTYNYVVFDDADVKIIDRTGFLFQSMDGVQQERRGGYSPSTRQIVFTEARDVSTFMHETAHWFLDTLEKLAPTEAWAAADLAEIEAWWAGVKDTPKMAAVRARYSVVPSDGGWQVSYRGQPMERPFATEAEAMARIEWRERQEAFAETFEQYLQTGKAPVPKLVEVFRAFRDWLVQLYKGMAPREREALNPAIQAVFDRVLAVDTEVDAASAEAFRDADTMAKDMLAKGVITERQYRMVGERLNKAREEVKEEMIARALQEEMRTREDWWAKEKARVKGDLARAFDKSEVGRAFNWLAYGEWKGDVVDDGEVAPERADALSDAELFQTGADRPIRTRLLTPPKDMSEVQSWLMELQGNRDPVDVAEILGMEYKPSAITQKNAVGERIRARIEQERTDALQLVYKRSRELKPPDYAAMKAEAGIPEEAQQASADILPFRPRSDDSLSQSMRDTIRPAAQQDITNAPQAPSRQAMLSDLNTLTRMAEMMLADAQSDALANATLRLRQTMEREDGTPNDEFRGQYVSGLMMLSDALQGVQGGDVLAAAVKQNLETGTGAGVRAALEHRGIRIMAPENIGEPPMLLVNEKAYEGDMLFQTAPAQPRTLFVAHNTSEEKLRKTLELGGFPMPSLAVARTDKGGFPSFGEITFLADPRILDEKDVTAYDADIYSPTVPEKFPKVSPEKAGAFVKKAKAFIPEGAMIPDYLGYDETDRELPRTLMNSELVQLAYLSEQGKAPKLKKLKVAKEVKAALATEYESPERAELALAYYTRLDQELNAARAEKGIEPTNIWVEDDGTLSYRNQRNFDDLISEAKRSPFDQKAYKSELYNRTMGTLAAREKFAQYTANLAGEITESYRIFKGFTYSGNRKWVPFNLENVMAEMRKDLREGNHDSFGGTGSIRARVGTTAMPKMKDVQRNRDRIVSEDEMKEIKDRQAERFMSLADEIARYYKFAATGLQYYDAAAEAIALGPKEWRENFTEEALPAIRAYVEELKALPTEYFEAKANRVMQIGDFAVAVVPRTVSPDIKQALQDAGVQVRYYKTGDEADRLRAIGQQDEMLFQTRTFNPPGHGPVAPPPDVPPVRLDLKIVRDLYGEEAVRKLPAALRRRSSTSSNVTDMLAMIETVRKTLAKKKRGPQTLTQFIMAKKRTKQDGTKEDIPWGIKGAADELKAMGLGKLINEKSGRTLDYVREAAEEAGFIRPRAVDADLNREASDLDTTLNDLLEALGREAKGEAVVRIGEEGDTKEAEDARVWADWLSQNGVDIYEADKKKLRASVEAMLSQTDESLISPDQAAELFGFPNGEELLKALAQVGNRDKFLDTQADRQLGEEFGDMMKDGTLIEEARAAARLSILGRQSEIELEALSRAVGQQASANYAKQMARDIIALRTVKEIAAYERDLDNERRFSKQALSAVAKGDYAAALKAKQRQIIAAQMYREGKKAHERIEKQRKDLLKYLTSEGRRDKIDAGYLEKIEDILDAFELRVSKQGPAVQRERTSAAKYVAEMDAAGREDEVAPEARLLAELAAKTTWRNLTGAEVDYLVGTVSNLAHLGRTKDSLIRAQEKRKFRALIDALTDRMNQTGKLPGVTRERSPTKTTTETLVDALREGHSWLMRPEHQARSLDGGELGPVWEAIFRPISEAGDVESRMMREATQLYRKAWDKFTSAERNAMSKRSISVPELPGIGKRFTKLDLISVALNWGVTYNHEVLLEGYGWTADQVEAALFRVLTDKDWDLVESIWAISGMYKAEAFAVEKDMTGVEPKSVEGISFTLPSGRKIEGKYYHIQYDASQPGKMSRRQAKDNDAEALSSHRKSRTKAMTKNGGLIERKGSGGRKVKLGLSVFEKALSETIHDIAFRRAVYDVGRIVADDQFADTYQEVAGMEAYRQLNVWLKDVAMPPMEVLDPIVKAFAHVRRNVPLAVMGYKVGTALIQPTGLLAAMPLVGHRRVLVAVARSFANLQGSMYGAWKQVASMSELMRDRVAGYERDVRETTTAMTKGGALDIMRRNAFVFITGMDIAVSVPTWMAAYGKAMDGKVKGIDAGNQEDAVAFADSIIRRTQTAGKTQDLSRFQRGGEFQKQISMIFGYFNNLYALSAQQTLDMRRGNLSKAQYAWHMTILFVAIPLFAELLAGRLIPDDDDEDEATIEGNIATTLISNFSGMFPGIRDAVALNLKPEFGYRMSPTAKFAEDIGKTAGLPLQLLLDDERELTEADVKRAVNTAGALRGIPSAQINISGDYIIDVLEGEEDPMADPADAAREALVRNTR